jgi:hypothetical protein
MPCCQWGRRIHCEQYGGRRRRSGRRLRGTANVTGANVSNITCTYSADRSRVNSVTFTLARDLAVGAVAEVQTGDSATVWNTCSITAEAATPALILCTVAAAPADITHLTLVVGDGGTHLTSIWPERLGSDRHRSGAATDLAVAPPSRVRDRTSSARFRGLPARSAGRGGNAPVIHYQWRWPHARE